MWKCLRMGLFRKKTKKADDILTDLRLELHTAAMKLEKKRKVAYVI